LRLVITANYPPEEAARRLGENAEAALSRVDWEVEGNGPRPPEGEEGGGRLSLLGAGLDATSRKHTFAHKRVLWTYAASTCTGNRGLKSRLSLPAMSLRRHW
jgi:hypothetical protein